MRKQRKKRHKKHKKSMDFVEGRGLVGNESVGEIVISDDISPKVNNDLMYSNGEIGQIRYVGKDILRIVVTAIIIIGALFTLYYVPSIHDWVGSTFGNISIS